MVEEVALRPFCGRLYSLSEWPGTGLVFNMHDVVVRFCEPPDAEEMSNRDMTPAYDTDYLLSRLRATTSLRSMGDQWVAFARNVRVTADSAPIALSQLAIELFRGGQLRR